MEKEKKKEEVKEETQKKDSKKGIIIIVAIVAALVVIIGTVVGLYLYNSSPKKIVSRVIEKTYEKYDKVMNNSLDYDFSKDTLKVSGDLNIDTNIEGYENIKNDNFIFDAGLDYKNQKIEAGIKVNEKKTTLIDVMTYVVDNEFYIDLADDYDKLIKYSDVKFDDLISVDYKKSNLTKDDLNYIVRAYKNILINSIDEKDLTKSTDTIVIDGKDTKVNKISYTIDDKNVEKIAKKMIEETLKDSELIKKLAKASGKEVVDVKYELEDAKDNFVVDEDLDIKLDIYTKGIMNTFVGMDLRKDKDNYLTLTVNKNNNTVIIKSEETKIQLDINELTEKKANIDYNVKYSDNKLSGNLTYTNNKIDNKRYEGKVNYYMNYNKQKLKLDLNYKIKINVPIAKIDVSKAQDIDDANLEPAYTKIYGRIRNSSNYDLLKNLFS